MLFHRLSAERLTTHCPVSVMGDADILAAEIASGISEFIRLDDCFYVTRQEHTDRGREFVVCCAEGKGLKHTAKEIVRRVKAAGFDFIRYHPKSRSFGRAVARTIGVRVTEFTDPVYYMLIDLRG